MSQVPSSTFLKIFKRHSVGDIRAYFESHSSDSPKLIKFERKRSTSESNELKAEPSANNLHSCIMDKQATAETFLKPNTPTQEMHKKSSIKSSLQQFTQAVGDIVGLPSASTPDSTPARKEPSTNSSTPSGTVSYSKKPSDYKDYLTLGGTYSSTPMSEVASMEGDLSADENIQLLDAGDGIINMIQLEGNVANFITCSAEVAPTNTPPLTSLPQRLRTRSTRRTPSRAMEAGKKTPPKQEGSAKRALPFSPDKLAAKTPRGSKSAPVSSASESEAEATMMETSTGANLNTKEANYQNQCCMKTQEIIEQLMSRIQQLELNQATTACTLDRFTSNSIDQMNGLTDTIVRLDSVVSKHDDDIIKIVTDVQEANERIHVLGHDIKKTDQTVTAVAGRQDQLALEWANMQKKLLSATVNNSSNTTQKNDDNAAFFLGGIHTLKEFYQSPNADPAQIARFLLTDLHMYCSMERCSIADSQARSTNDRRSARAVIIVMRSAQHKREAIIRIKRYLGQHGIRNVTVNDIFPQGSIDRVKVLSKFAQKGKNEQKILKYRVINKEGAPTLQIMTSSNNRFHDFHPTDEQLASLNEGSLAAGGPTPMETDSSAMQISRNPRNPSREVNRPSTTTRGRSSPPLRGANAEPVGPPPYLIPHRT